MKVPENIKKCVAFIAMKMADDSFRLCGTVFFVYRDNSEKKIIYATTAKHVIDGVKSKGLEEVYLRINRKDNTLTWIRTKLSDWIYHDDINVDIAIHPMAIATVFDHQVFPMSRALNTNLMSA